MLLDLTFLNSYGLAGVLLITFLAFTILPFPYEAAIIIATLANNPFYVLLFAFIGSMLGSLTNYYFGLKGVRKLLPKKKSKLKINARKIFDKYGNLSVLLFSWFPLIGDPIIILAGGFKMKLSKFLIYASIGRIIYFSLLIWFGVGIELPFENIQ